MHRESFSFRQLFALLFVTFISLLAATALEAWTGPTASAPGGNAPAPLNVGTSDQVKNAGLSVNAFAAFGDSYFAGNVGIGATNPAQKLVVNGDSWLTGNLIVQSGNVGIGTASPGSNLEVDGSSVQNTIRTGALRVSGSGTSAQLETGVNYNFNDGTGNNGWIQVDINKMGTPNPGNLLINPAGGNVGIGTASPHVPFQVGNYTGSTNTIAAIADNPYGYSLELSTLWASNYVNAASYLIRGGCWAGDCASDARVKDHVRPFTPGLGALSDINPVYYRYNGLGGMPKMSEDGIGLIAQDVEKSAPELVTTKSVKLRPDDATSTDIKEVNYSALQYVLINAVKELNAKTDAQQKEIDGLKAQLRALQSK